MNLASFALLNLIHQVQSLHHALKRIRLVLPSCDEGHWILSAVQCVGRNRTRKHLRLPKRRPARGELTTPTLAAAATSDQGRLCPFQNKRQGPTNHTPQKAETLPVPRTDCQILTEKTLLIAGHT